MRLRQPLLLLIFLFPFILPGCSDKQIKQHTFYEYVEDGVSIAANTGGPKYEGDLFRYKKVVTLQQDPDRPESFLYQSRSFIRTEKGFFLDEDGRFYVNDSGGARIAVYDATGRFERAIGRRGEGPGEFVLCELYELSDGVLKIYDHSLHRTTCYRTDGTLMEMVRGRGRYYQDHELFVRFEGPAHYDDNGHLWLGTGFLAMTAGMDTFGTAKTREIRIKYAFSTPGHGKGGMSRPDMPFTARPFGRYFHDGSVLLTDGVEPVLWWYWLDGSIRKRIDLGLSMQSVTQQDIRRFYRDLDEQITTADDNTKVYLEWMRNAVVFPEYKTLWNHISVDDEGYIWLEGYEMDFEQRDKGGGFTYYLLNPEGEYLGTTRAPAVGRIIRGLFMGDYVVWRLVPQPEGFIYP